MLNEFKKFAVKGNMLDMAVGIVIGAAFGTIVKSLVSDILMPPLGILMGGMKFSELKLTLKEAVTEGDKVLTEAVTINYGTFIDNIIAFLIVAFALFMVVKGMNKFKEKEEEKPAAPPKQEVLLEEIRDLLKKNA
ncbi:MAG: large-conductance mechanosensitive channel protein MscL [Planctomycetota bacterium]|nr:large-conductance mechanosensitive channel protein MscL [Planctomycetota bacterium]